MSSISERTEHPFFFDRRWPVLFVDNHLLAVYKPSGLLVQGDRTGDACLLDLARQWIKVQYHKPGNVFLAMVHRLDRPVAGVVLFARTSKAAARLSRQFRERSVSKNYLAVVHGAVDTPSDRLIHHIERRNRYSRVVRTPTSRSQEARMCYTLVGCDGEKSLLKVSLETGRRHQIRLQLAHVGHPILGDLRYGAGRPLQGKAIALLAQQLAVDHPTRGTRLQITSPIPLAWPWSRVKAAEADSPPWNWRWFNLKNN